MLYLVLSITLAAPGPDPEATRALKKAATFYREKAAVRGGYVYFSTPDMSER